MKSFPRRKAGQAMVEYIIIVVVVAIAALVIFGLFGDTIQNYSVHGYRRVELVAQLDNSADVGRAIALLKEGLKRVPNQFEGMGGDVEVLEFSERGPRLAVRPYTHTDNYWQVYFDTNRLLRDELDAAEFPVRMAVQKLIVEQLHK